MEWIKCSERLPEHGEECLVAFHLKKKEYGYCFHLATFIDKQFYSWELNKKINKVTHWMELPKPPEED